MSISVILFDFFGVISTPVYKKVIDTYVSEDERSKWMDKLDDLDLGILPEVELINQLAKHTDTTYEEIEKAALAAPVLNRELLEFIRLELVNRFSVGLLTNIPRNILERTLSESIALFDPVLASSDLQLIKPDPEIFHEALRRLGVSAEEVIFIDDSEKNISVANDLGMKGIVYSDFQGFETKLLQHL